VFLPGSDFGHCFRSAAVSAGAALKGSAVPALARPVLFEVGKLAAFNFFGLTELSF
jgi:hypothetical protein